jgi:hypothetical protein
MRYSRIVTGHISEECMRRIRKDTDGKIHQHNWTTVRALKLHPEHDVCIVCGKEKQKLYPKQRTI